MRQIVDYYYVLKSLGEDERKYAREDIRVAGLSDFAGAVMYVLHHALSMGCEGLICNQDKKRGKLLLREIMQGGNFGKYDARLLGRGGDGLIMSNIPSWRRQLGFMRYYPADIICIPFWKVWHWCWRKWKGYL